MIESLNNHSQWRNAPISLKPEWVADPYIVLEEYFFPRTPLPKVREFLEKYMTAALSTNYKWKRNGIITCLYRFHAIRELLEALWIIHKRDYEFDERIFKERDEEQLNGFWSDKTEQQIKDYSYHDIQYWPALLSHEELLNPFGVVHTFFEKQDLFDVKEKVGFWCHTALANRWNYPAMENHDVVSLRDELMKLIEAAFIIVEVHLLVKEEKISPYQYDRFKFED